MVFDFTKLLNDFIFAHLDWVLLLLTVISLLSLFFFVVINARLSSISKKYTAIMRGVNGKNLEALLMEYMDSVASAKSDFSELKDRIEALEKESLNAIKKVHIKRYNAFEDMGGNLSFSISLLNGHNSGVLITSIYGRDENRVYLKPVVNGSSTYPLSPEEKEVLEEAISGKGFFTDDGEF
ncbi:DUF4446 family protein [Thermosediminibacter oceani]|uniref:DUF4446 domain-containing protein n=1 Tax=Thermosediminibacter oceani (strain ATCC BAA-1034 / DSM 16646 / JW/IW-1228P) TaxID=555079 RepID=D9S199_THEOJ|nr:DUF4446 family protein [Thermosediminibacter oceani]ADL08978.1 conserved hypothetical protein [Thermosediminibacter oceani DSM 16646]